LLGGESWQSGSFSGRSLLLCLIERAFNVAGGDHMLVVLIKLDPVSLDEVVILPSPRIDRVHRDALLVLSVGALGSDEDGRLGVFEWRRVIGRLAAVISRAHIASGMRFVS